MISKFIDFESPLANGIRAFISYKRSLGRKYYTEEKNLRLLDRYLVEQKIIHTNNISPDILDSFLTFRPQKRARSYNDLVGILNRFFNWLVVQEIIESSPLNARRRRETEKQIPYIFDREQARRILEIAICFADSSSAPMRGATYQMISALLYGLGLRVGEVSRLHREDIDFRRDLLIIRHTKFSKSRFVPFGPRMAARLHNYIKQRENRFGKLVPGSPVSTAVYLTITNELLTEANRKFEQFAFHALEEDGV